MTDEQYSALIAGVAAVIAFSQPIQNKLSTTIPQFLTEAGTRSTTGLMATGLIAAIVFYLAQRFLNK
jgi:membrane-anchored glycerophosphoryl diester phosphodiesterase (GDPDase)